MKERNEASRPKSTTYLLNERKIERKKERQRERKKEREKERKKEGKKLKENRI